MQITKKLYPVPEECQLQDSDRVPATKALAYLNSIVKRQPDDIEGEVYVTGWKNISVYVDRMETPAEILQRQRDAAIDAIKGLLNSENEVMRAWAQGQLSLINR